MPNVVPTQLFSSQMNQRDFNDEMTDVFVVHSSRLLLPNISVAL